MKVIDQHCSEFPPHHGYASGGSEFYAKVEMSTFDINAVIMTASVHDVKQTAWLWWTEGINEWCEQFPSVSVALGRLAVLIGFGENGWVDGFSLNESQFAEFWEKSVS